MANTLSAIEIQPTAEHQYSVIWLHGLGADGHDFEGIVPSLKLTEEAHIHFVFPNAPIQSVTINSNLKMRAWYDIKSVSLEKHEVDTGGIYRSAAMINNLISQEIDKGIPSKNIVLAGFSQGGAIALHTGLRYPQKLAGIIALSTYLPTLDKLSLEGSNAGKITPVFMAHGILDPVVAVEAGKAVFDRLTAESYNIEWHDYLMEHSVCPEEIAEISVFLNLILR